MCISASVFSQGEVVGVPTYRYQASSAITQKTGDTIFLPFRDDFSGSSNVPRTDLWTDAKAYVNNTFPIGQWSRGVATFDGLDEGGKAYDINRIQPDTLADVLTSKYINLTGVTSPYLVFLYQKGGWGEAPESGDSLVVDFWNVDSTRWERVWSVNGGGDLNEWDWAAVSANDPKWLKNGFRFRIGTYGAHNGGYDVWNLDYLSLESNRTAQDTVISDPAMTIPHPVLTNNFKSIPWFHMGSAQFRQNLTFGYRRNGPVPPGFWSLNLGKYRLYQDGALLDEDLTVPVVTIPDHNVDLDFTTTYNTGSINTSPTGPTELNMITWFDGEAVGIRNNDSIILNQTFDNDYGYDDGSAERVYGLTDANSYILYRFQPLVSDTLKGFKIFFGQADNDVTTEAFKLVVYAFQNNAPGQLIYESDSSYFPEFVGGNNQFGYYQLDTSGVYINGTVYIGVKQLTSTPMTIGLDRNNGGDTIIIYGDGNTWYPSRQRGALMLRPYFKYHPTDISVPEISTDSDIRMYPNPTDAWFCLDNFAGEIDLQIIDLNGRVVMDRTGLNPREEVDIQSLPPGFYFVRWRREDDTGVEKLLIH